jgi:ABC-type uncharacterized transport system YnjBCD ATPase subunit
MPTKPSGRLHVVGTNPAPIAVPAVAAHLPVQMTSLVGRERELAAIIALIINSDVALVTLTGPGGAGKTRLALRIAADLGGDFANGTCFVDLSSLRTPDMVAPAIARELGVLAGGDLAIEQHLAVALRDRRLLLVLDNFEQVPMGRSSSLHC